MQYRTQLDAVTTAGTTYSEFNSGTGTLVGLFVPALSATTLYFETKDKAGTWYAVRDLESATAYAIPVGTAGFVPVDPNVFVGCASIRIAGNTSEPSTKSLYPVTAQVA